MVLSLPILSPEGSEALMKPVEGNDYDLNEDQKAFSFKFTHEPICKTSYLSDEISVDLIDVDS